MFEYFMILVKNLSQRLKKLQLMEKLGEKRMAEAQKMIEKGKTALRGKSSSIKLYEVIKS